MTQPTIFRKSDTANRVCFYEQDFYPFSNFSSFHVEHPLLGNFDTAEKLYHALKFVDFEPMLCRWDIARTPLEERTKLKHPDIIEEIRYARSAHDAFKISRKYEDKVRPDWVKKRLFFMMDVLILKSSQHGYVLKKLLDSGVRKIVEDSWRDPFWGEGEDGKGENWCGTCWMILRSVLKAPEGMNKFLVNSTSNSNPGISALNVFPGNAVFNLLGEILAKDPHPPVLWKEVPEEQKPPVDISAALKVGQLQSYLGQIADNLDAEIAAIKHLNAKGESCASVVKPLEALLNNIRGSLTNVKTRAYLADKLRPQLMEVMHVIRVDATSVMEELERVQSQTPGLSTAQAFSGYSLSQKTLMFAQVINTALENTAIQSVEMDPLRTTIANAMGELNALVNTASVAEYIGLSTPTPMETADKIDKLTTRFCNNIEDIVLKVMMKKYAV